MREIKFRAWFDNPLIRKMIHDETPGDALRWKFQERQGCEVMQFTGLKDRNGVEIYEGDILTADYDNLLTFTGAVEFTGHGFWMLLPNGERFMPNNSEVIGNIYENPELLKES